MKLFVFEYASAGGEGGEPFRREGAIMLSSLLSDLAKLKRIEVTTILSKHLSYERFPSHRIANPGNDFFETVEDEIKRCDAVWLIAPETDQILKNITVMAERFGKKVVGSSSEAVELFGDKLKSSERFDGIVSVPRTIRYEGTLPFYPAVIKPRDGAGGESVFKVDHPDELPHLHGSYIAQPFVEGETLSAGAIASDADVKVIGVCRQQLDISERLTLKAVSGPIEYPRMDELSEMFGRIKNVSTGLLGYFGVDFIDNGKEIIIIEVNPRLTTSYPLYSKSAERNLGGEILSACALEGF